MKIKAIALAAGIGALMLGSFGARADTLVTYTVTNAPFLTGGNATGSFTIDFNDNGTVDDVQSWNITTVNVLGSVIGAYSNTTGVLGGDTSFSTNGGNDNVAFVDPTHNNILFQLSLTGEVSPAGGTLGFEGTEAGNGQARLVLSGSLDGTVADATPVPLPPAAWLLLGGLALIGVQRLGRARMAPRGGFAIPA